MGKLLQFPTKPYGQLMTERSQALHDQRRAIWREIKQSWWWKKAPGNYVLLTSMHMISVDRMPSRGKVRDLMFEFNELTGECKRLRRDWVLAEQRGVK